MEHLLCVGLNNLLFQGEAEKAKASDQHILVFRTIHLQLDVKNALPEPVGLMILCDCMGPRTKLILERNTL